MLRYAFVTLPALLVLAAAYDRPTKGEEEPAATPPLLSIYGRQSRIERQGFYRIESADAWKRHWAKHQTGEEKPASFPGDKPHLGVDFTRCMVVSLFDGTGTNFNCDGYEVESIDEGADRIRLRVRGLHFQTHDALIPTTAWGAFVLPRSEKPIVLELDTNRDRLRQPKWAKVADLKSGNSSVLK
ncbi:unnamed protein product [Gemmata massiliana]|uniref:Uncharacterized protein n=1 Tax=Gemmata massiliana TaxID=1210884 RepID=A0A6P2CZN5_9BACT|nr:hypothetical protein [Gemmata massiliana]VTR93264.1 unnamed protein product [Gemmata massiliana]